MGARKYLVSDKRGVVAYRKVSMKNLRANYVPRALCGRRVVYSKVVRYGDIEEIVGLRSRKYKIRPGYQKKAIEKVEKRRKREEEERRKREFVEVKGLVSVYSVSDGVQSGKNSPFTAEMRFTWWGPKGFDEFKLLTMAVDVLLESLPELERIPYELVSTLVANEAIGARGIESVEPYDGPRENEMDYQIFIPNSMTGRALMAGSARVVA